MRCGPIIAWTYATTRHPRRDKSFAGRDIDRSKRPSCESFRRYFSWCYKRVGLGSQTALAPPSRLSSLGISATVVRRVAHRERQEQDPVWSSRQMGQIRRWRRTPRPDEDQRGLSELDRVSRRRPGRLKSTRYEPYATGIPPT